MKTIKFIKRLFFLVVFITTLNCNPDPCEVSHTMVNGECIPDFIYPPNQNLQSGERYYHKKYGVVTIKNGVWYDKKNNSIVELNGQHSFN